MGIAVKRTDVSIFLVENTLSRLNYVKGKEKLQLKPKEQNLEVSSVTSQ